MKVAFHTLGCKVNQYETQVMKQLFIDKGYDIVDFNQTADVYVINSCTVTGSGDKKTKQLLNSTKKHHPDSTTVLSGCFPQAFPDIATDLHNADVVVGSYNRNNIVQMVEQFSNSKQRVVNIIKHTKGEPFEVMSANDFSNRTRAFIKIQDGCDRYCSYCIIPTARGPIRSKLIDDIVTEVTTMSENGHKEIVLVGINLSSYGRDEQTAKSDNPVCLVDVVERVASISSVKRVRLGSLEPELLTEEQLDRLSKVDKFCDQFHLSLQSGSDGTLERMRRHYTTDEYYEIVRNIKKRFKNPTITTDVMVGFAGETPEEFEQSIQFVEKVGFSKIHVFAYSKRTSTVAYNMPNHVDEQTKKIRCSKMIALGEQLTDKFLRSQLNSVQSVLFEENNQGYTHNYARVKVQSDTDLAGQILDVTITEVKEDYLIGEINLA